MSTGLHASFLHSKALKVESSVRFFVAVVQNTHWHVESYAIVDLMTRNGDRCTHALLQEGIDQAAHVLRLVDTRTK